MAEAKQSSMMVLEDDAEAKQSPMAMVVSNHQDAGTVQQAPLKFGFDCLFGEGPAPAMDPSAQLVVNLVGQLRLQQSNLFDVAENLAPAQMELVMGGKKVKDVLAECNRNLLETSREVAVACTILRMLPSQLERLFGILEMDAAGGNKPMEAEEIDSQLACPRVAQAINVLATKARDAIVIARDVTDFIIRNLGGNAQLQGHYDNLEKVRADIAAQEGVVRTAEDTFLDSRSNVARLDREKDELLALGQGQDAHRAYLQACLAQAKEELKRVKALEENYTYRGWGPFKTMWEKDIALATANRERQQQVVADLEAKLQAPSDLSALQTKTIENTAARNRARNENDNREKGVKAAQQNLDKLKDKLKETEVAIRNILKTMKVQSVPQLLRAYAAAKSFDQVSRSTSVGGVANNEGLNMYFSTLGSYLKRIKSQPNAKAQMLAVRFIYRELAQNGSPAAVLSEADASFADNMIRRIGTGERENMMARVQHITLAKPSPASLAPLRPAYLLAHNEPVPEVTVAPSTAAAPDLSQTPAGYQDPFM